MKTLEKILSLGLCLILALSLVACSPSQEAAPPEPEPEIDASELFDDIQEDAVDLDNLDE